MHSCTPACLHLTTLTRSIIDTRNDHEHPQSFPAAAVSKIMPARYPLERIIIAVAVGLVVFFNFQLSWVVQEFSQEPQLQLPVPKPQRRRQAAEESFLPVVLRQPSPVFVVGLPKVGTSSIHALFACSGVRSSHYCCCGSNRTHTHCNDGDGRTFSECMRGNLKSNRPILQGCGDYQVYAQMDAELGKGIFLPQRFQLDALHAYAPNATFLLNVRPSHDWVHSVSNWFGLGGRFLNRFKIDVRNVNRQEVLREIYDNHTVFVRDFVRQHPSHKLVEVDISSPMAGQVLANAFGVDESCWGQHNRNKNKVK
jgi:hypothetical protein